MQIPPADVVNTTSARANAAVNVRVLAGNLAAIPLGALLSATVTQVNPREATLNVNGQSLTIKPPPGLEVGTALFVRVPKSGNGTLEIADPPRAPKAPPQLAAPAEPGQVQVLDVTAALPDGRVRVNIDGQEQIATPSEPLAPGGRFVLEVTRTPSGITLRPATESTSLSIEVATAILRSAPAPDVVAILKPLQTELKALVEGQPTKGALAVPPAVRAAATAVQTTLEALVPSEPRALDAPELQRLVSNGGIQFEAKLARLVGEPATPGSARASSVRTGPSVSVAPVPVESLLKPGVAITATGKPATVTAAPNAVANPTPATAALPRVPEIAAGLRAGRVRNLVERVAEEARLIVAGEAKGATRDSPQPNTPDASHAQVATALGGDLKGDLLRLLQTARELGVVSQVPVARTALAGIESQQATQTLAQATQTAYMLQVPFPDGGAWHTLHLSVEREVPPNQVDPDRDSRFRMLMHVPLSELGDTWIDAGLSGGSFRAAIYLDRADVRDRVAAALPELRTGLRADGFDEVLLDVRPTSALPARAKRLSAAMTAGHPTATSLLDVRA